MTATPKAFVSLSRYPADSLPDLPEHVKAVPILDAAHMCWYRNGEPYGIEFESPWSEADKTHQMYPVNSLAVEQTAERLMDGDIPGVPAGTTHAITGMELGACSPYLYHEDATRRPMSALAHIGMVRDLFAEYGIDILCNYNLSYWSVSRNDGDHLRAHDLMGNPSHALIKINAQDGRREALDRWRSRGAEWHKYRNATDTTGIIHMDAKEIPMEHYDRTLDANLRVCSVETDDGRPCLPLFFLDEGPPPRKPPTDEELRKLEMFFERTV